MIRVPSNPTLEWSYVHKTLNISRSLMDAFLSIMQIECWVFPETRISLLKDSSSDA